MNISTTIRFVCFTILLLATQFLAAAHNGFTDAEAEAIQAFLRENFGNTNAGMVIGLVDERGSRVLAVGKLDNGTRQEVDGDTVFEIGSVTKTFTTLLLQDMVERDEVKLDDPVAKYLPESVKVPARDGKQITLLNLATHTAGLPRDPSNLTPTRAARTARHVQTRVHCAERFITCPHLFLLQFHSARQQVGLADGWRVGPNQGRESV